MASSDKSDFREVGLQVGPLTLEAPVGIGTNKWGVSAKYDADKLAATYSAALAGGASFFNTAQFYNSGESEECLGRLREANGGKGIIVSKFASMQRAPEELLPSLRETLARCKLEKIDAFLIHHPKGSPTVLADQLALAVKEGLAATVGVSNYGEAELRSFHALMAERGVPLLWNEIEFSLLRRAPERNGLLAACKELGVTVLAWAPLASGRLTGKHAESQTDKASLALLDAMRAIGEARGRTVAQVAINWCVCKGTVPIPGARTEKQAVDNSGGAGWRLSEAEVATLDTLAVDQQGMYDDPEALFAFLGWWPNKWVRPFVAGPIWAGMGVAKFFLPLQHDKK